MAASVFVRTGTLMQASTPNEVIGVLAHRSGHIAGGHMAAAPCSHCQGSDRALLVQLLGIGAMIGGAVSGGDGGREVSSAGQGVMMGGNEADHAWPDGRAPLAGSAADQAGLSYLNATQQSGLGMLTTFERFAGQELFSDAPKRCLRAHASCRDRPSCALCASSRESSAYFGTKDRLELQLRHDMMRAKLSGYIEPPTVVFNRYPPSDTSLPAVMRARPRGSAWAGKMRCSRPQLPRPRVLSVRSRAIRTSGSSRATSCSRPAVLWRPSGAAQGSATQE